MKQKIIIFFLILNFSFIIHNSTNAQTTLMNEIEIWEEIDSIRYDFQKKTMYDSAFFYAEKALKIAETEFGKKDTLYANSIKALGLLYQYSGKLKKAEELFFELLSLRKEILGENHIDYAIVIHMMGGIYKELGEYAKAEKYYLDCLKAKEKIIGKKHKFYGITLNDLAVLYTYTGEYKKSIATGVEYSRVISFFIVIHCL